MQIIENDHVVMFDCDDTLVMWLWGYELQEAIAEGRTKQIMDSDGKMSNTIVPHIEHIELLKRYKGKGKFIVVWTASGYDWGKAVVKGLELDQYVDLIMTKPEKYVDDLHADEFMERVYIGTINKTTPHN